MIIKLDSKRTGDDKWITKKRVLTAAAILVGSAFLLALSSMPGAAAGENLHYNQSPTSDAQFSEISKRGFLSGLTGFLSFARGPDTVSPGESFEIDLEVDATKDVYTDQSRRIVEVYKCKDSGCDNPPPIDSASEDQCSSEEWAPDYDDCIYHAETETEFPYQMDEGSSWGWTMDYTAPQDEGYYTAIAYLYDSNDGGIVTTTPKHKFEVVDSSESTTEPQPELTQYSLPTSNYDESADKVSATVRFENEGGADMSESRIVEMQIRPKDGNLLSFVSNNKVCDSDTPENIHKEFLVDAGESEAITLSTDNLGNLEKGKEYDIRVLTRQGCYPNNDAVEPIPTDYTAGSFCYKCSEETDNTDTEPQVKIEQASANQKVTVSNGKIIGEIGLINTGEKEMQEKHILEMQVVPKDTGLMSFVSGTEQVCNSNNPQNVHKKFRLAAGETANIKLTTSTSHLEPGKKYDVWFLTRNKCYSTEPVGNEPVEPHGKGVKVNTLEVQENDNIVVKPPSGLPLVPIATGLGVFGLLGMFYWVSIRG